MSHQSVYYFIPQDCDEPTVQFPAMCVNCHETYHIVVTERQYNRRRNTGDYVQDIWPELSAGHREMIISGTHPDCFDQMFSPDEPNEM
jgi:hypothetical protein